MFSWLRTLLSNKIEISWQDLKAGDLICVDIKSPHEVGIISDDPARMSFQRLDSKDIETRKIMGFVIETKKRPGPIETLNFYAIKQTGLHTRLVEYVLLREEIKKITLVHTEEE